MAEQGADILDIGAESTRPYGGAKPVSADDELARLKPVLSAVVALGLPVSIDTVKADVAAFCGALRATRPARKDFPVMVAGDPQWQTAEKRMAQGIPIGKGLREKLRKVAEAANVEWLLGGNEAENTTPGFDQDARSQRAIP